MSTPDDAARILERTRTQWTERVEMWNACSEQNRFASDRPADLDRIAAALKLAPGIRLLDAGCGSGQFALEMAARGAQVTGVDLSPAMIERARSHGAERQIDVEWRVGDLSSLPDPAHHYDAIMARATLQFVPNPWTALQEFGRVIRPGGRLFASVPGALSPIYRKRWQRFERPDEATTNGILPWELEAILGQLGWSIQDQWGGYGQDHTGNENPFTAETIRDLDLRLQQAAATLWTIIADPPPGEPGQATPEAS
jgi:SAM-dependent methyltransferase